MGGESVRDLWRERELETCGERERDRDLWRETVRDLWRERELETCGEREIDTCEES